MTPRMVVERSSMPQVTLKVIDLSTGKVEWQRSDYGANTSPVAQIEIVDGDLWALRQSPTEDEEVSIPQLRKLDLSDGSVEYDSTEEDLEVSGEPIQGEFFSVDPTTGNFVLSARLTGTPASYAYQLILAATGNAYSLGGGSTRMEAIAGKFLSYQADYWRTNLTTANSSRTTITTREGGLPIADSADIRYSNAFFDGWGTGTEVLDPQYIEAVADIAIGSITNTLLEAPYSEVIQKDPDSETYLGSDRTFNLTLDGTTLTSVTQKVLGIGSNDVLRINFDLSPSSATYESFPGLFTAWQQSRVAVFGNSQSGRLVINPFGVVGTHTTGFPLSSGWPRWAFRSTSFGGPPYYNVLNTFASFPPGGVSGLQYLISNASVNNYDVEFDVASYLGDSSGEAYDFGGVITATTVSDSNNYTNWGMTADGTGPSGYPLAEMPDRIYTSYHGRSVSCLNRHTFTPLQDGRIIRQKYSARGARELGTIQAHGEALREDGLYTFGFGTLGSGDVDAYRTVVIDGDTITDLGTQVVGVASEKALVDLYAGALDQEQLGLYKFEPDANADYTPTRVDLEGKLNAILGFEPSINLLDTSMVCVVSGVVYWPAELSTRHGEGGYYSVVIAYDYDTDAIVDLYRFGVGGEIEDCEVHNGKLILAGLTT